MANQFGRCFLQGGEIFVLLLQSLGRSLTIRNIYDVKANPFAFGDEMKRLLLCFVLFVMTGGRWDLPKANLKTCEKHLEHCKQSNTIAWTCAPDGGLIDGGPAQHPNTLQPIDTWDSEQCASNEVCVEFEDLGPMCEPDTDTSTNF